MSYRPYPPPAPLLIGYDPFFDLPPDHLARLVDQVVEQTVRPPQRATCAGQPPYDPRLCVKVLIYSYCTGIRSSRVMERQCQESLPFLFLTRGDTPSYHTLCNARTSEGAYLEAVWEGLFAVAAGVGLERLGRITVDSSKFRADASPEAVVKREEFAAVRAELERILAQAAAADAREAAEGAVGQTRLGQPVPPEQMRDILRRVRRRGRDAAPPAAPPARPDPGAAAGMATLPELDLETEAAPTEDAPTEGGGPAGMTPQMLVRVAAGLKALQEAEADGRKHLCLTDPDARMMYGGRERGTRECYSFEVVVDQGLLVVAQVTQDTHDNTRLEPLVAAARAHEPGGVTAVDADSGYYAGDAVGRLLAAGLDTCVPDSNTAGDLHRGRPIGTTRDRSRGQVEFVYDPAADVYRCPEGNVLRPTQQRQERGQHVWKYRAQNDCQSCPQAGVCLTRAHARHRTLNVGAYQAELAAAQQRFAEADHQERYHHRGEAVETIFGFIRGTLGYRHWWLRGLAKVQSEARLFKTAYQFRKVHAAQRAAAGAG